MNTLTKEIHNFTCGNCGIVFQSQERSQLGAANGGRSVYCSDECRIAANIDKCRVAIGRHISGPCKTCGKLFRSKAKGRLYCNMQCYMASPELAERLKDCNDQKRLNNECVACGKITKKSNKYCSDHCRRTWFAERFDRFVANPEGIALPHNYDEFMIKERLPCLVEGCDWVGEHLGRHVNFTHGITADQFRELCGFNKTTGLATVRLKEEQGERMRQWLADGTIVTPAKFEPGHQSTRPGKPSFRNEAREHRSKCLAVIVATRPPKTGTCVFCGGEMALPVFGERKYCTTRCRTAHYRNSGKATLNCSYCGQQFLGNRTQVLRASREQPVCCSTECRNRRNIAILLATRGHS